MFSAGVPVPNPCENSNDSFLESENDTAMTGISPEYYSVGHDGMEVREVCHSQGFWSSQMWPLYMREICAFRVSGTTHLNTLSHPEQLEHSITIQFN